MPLLLLLLPNDNRIRDTISCFFILYKDRVEQGIITR